MKKKCFKCGLEKDLNLFYKNRCKLDGHSATCIDCRKIYARAYCKGEVYQSKVRRYYRNNIEKVRKSRRVFYKLNRDYVLERNRKYNHKDNGLYMKYSLIKNRCVYKGSEKMKHYGAKGIKLLWADYDSFKKDMYESYIKHLNIHGHKDTTIDRIDSDGHYCKENCRWATMKEQYWNRKCVTHKKVV